MKTDSQKNRINSPSGRWKAFLYTLTIVFALNGCAASLNDWTKPDFTDRTFKKIAVVGVSDNLEARIAFERSAVERLRSKGVNAVEGLTIFPAKMSPLEQTEENLLRLVQDNNLDGVITMALIDTNESTRYEPGESYTYLSGYARFENYYFRRYSTINTPGYYVDTKSYLIEAVLHDLKGELTAGQETIVWSGQSSLVDPASIRGAADKFTRNMISHLLKKGIVKSSQ